MRILIFGGTGMLGHKLALVLSTDHSVVITTRTGNSPIECGAVQFNEFGNIAVLEKLLDRTRPDVVINAIGIIKQIASATLEQININAVFPQQMAACCAARNIRFITFGTDCVFDGMTGAPYREGDVPTAHDVYGMTKYLGEILGNSCALTLRSSIIGPELRGKKSLFEWILQNRGKTVFGYTKALYTGLPTIEMANVIKALIEQYPTLSGVWQIASDAIDKASLIRLVSQQFELDITVENDTEFFCDRRLDGTHFRQVTSYKTPTWPELVAGLHRDYLANRALYQAAES